MFYLDFKHFRITNYYPLANEVVRGYSNATVLPSVRHNPCEHSRINILQWILTKLGTYLVLKRIWNPIDFQGQRSRSQGLIFRRGDTPRFALPLLNLLTRITKNYKCKFKDKIPNILELKFKIKNYYSLELYIARKKQ